jgi:hypothetical protein
LNLTSEHNDSYPKGEIEMRTKRIRNETLKLAVLTDDAPVSSRAQSVDSGVNLLNRAITVLALTALVLMAAGAHAEEASPGLAGRWDLAGDAAEEKQRLRAIDDATERLPRMQRGRARDMLAGRTSPPESLAISFEGSMVTIGSVGRELELELGGPPIEISGEQGKAQLSATMEGEQLIVTADGGKGGRTSTYSADGDRLLVEVTMTGARLAEPLNYVSTYERVE